MPSPDETPDSVVPRPGLVEPAQAAEPAPVAWPPAAPARKPLDATKAALIFLGYVACQLVVAMFAASAIAVVGGATGRFDPADTLAVESAVAAALPWILLLTMVACGAVVYFLGRSLAGPELQLRESAGAAWVAGHGIELAFGLAVGLGTAVASVVLTSGLFPAPDDLPMGPLAQMATGTALEQATWVLLALVLAPPIEEMLFRGILLGGFARSFGVAWAAVLVTGLFVAMHLPEAVFYPPALIGIALLALAALGARLATGAVGPAIAVHLAYNGVVVLAALLSQA